MISSLMKLVLLLRPLLAEMLGKTNEAACPAMLLRLARLLRFKPAVIEPEQCLAVLLGEAQRYQRLMPGFTIFVLPRPGKGEAVGFADLLVDPAHRVFFPFRRAHDDPIGTAHSKINSARHYRKSFGAKPSFQLVPLGEGLEHATARCRKAARQIEDAVGIGCGRFRASCHDASSFPCRSPPGRRSGGRSSAPRNAGRFPASRWRPSAAVPGAGTAAAGPLGCGRSGRHAPAPSSAWRSPAWTCRRAWPLRPPRPHPAPAAPGSLGAWDRPGRRRFR